jgi:hypothetical protein
MMIEKAAIMYQSAKKSKPKLKVKIKAEGATAVSLLKKLGMKPDDGVSNAR